MWLLVLLVLSVVTTLIYFKYKRVNEKYRLDRLALISWGATVMFTVDAVYAYLEGEEPIEFTVDAALLSILLVATAIVLWLISLRFKK